MILKITACSIIGSRTDNEDNLLISKLKNPAVLKGDRFFFDSKYVELKNQCMTFAVCDGMGGKENGERASLCVIKQLHKLCEKRSSDIDWKKINEECRKKAPGSGSTCSMVTLICEKEQVSAEFQSIGDSFLYQYKGDEGTIELMTPLDNAAAQLAERGIDPTSEEYIFAESVLLNYIGKDYNECDIPIHKNIATIKGGDKLVIASDGISPLSAEAITEELFDEDFGQNTACAIVFSAISKNKDYAADNTTVIVLEFEE